MQCILSVLTLKDLKGTKHQPVLQSLSLCCDAQQSERSLKSDQLVLL